MHLKLQFNVGTIVNPNNLVLNFWTLFITFSLLNSSISSSIKKPPLIRFAFNSFTGAFAEIDPESWKVIQQILKDPNQENQDEKCSDNNHFDALICHFVSLRLTWVGALLSEPINAVSSLLWWRGKAKYTRCSRALPQALSSLQAIIEQYNKHSKKYNCTVEKTISQ